MEFIVVFDRMWCLAWPGLDYWKLILKSDVLVSIIQSVLKIGSRLYVTRQHVIINHTVKIPNRVLSSSTPNHTDLAQNLAFWWVPFMRKASLLCLEISICLTVGNSNKVLNNELMEPREPLSKPLASLQPSPDNTQMFPHHNGAERTFQPLTTKRRDFPRHRLSLHSLGSPGNIAFWVRFRGITAHMEFSSVLHSGTWLT